MKRTKSDTEKVRQLSVCEPNELALLLVNGELSWIVDQFGPKSSVDHTLLLCRLVLAEGELVDTSLKKKVPVLVQKAIDINFERLSALLCVIYDYGQVGAVFQYLPSAVETITRKQTLALDDVNFVVRITNHKPNRQYLRQMGFLAQFKSDGYFHLLFSYIYKDAEVSDRAFKRLCLSREVYMYRELLDLRRSFETFVGVVSQKTVERLYNELELRSSNKEFSVWLEIAQLEPVRSIADIGFSSAVEFLERARLQHEAQTERQLQQAVHKVLERVRQGRSSKYCVLIEKITVQEVIGGLVNDSLKCEVILSTKEQQRPKSWATQHGVFYSDKTIPFKVEREELCKDGLSKFTAVVDAQYRADLANVKYAIRAGSEARNLKVQFPRWMDQFFSRHGDKATETPNGSSIRLIAGPVCSGKSKKVSDLIKSANGRVLVVAKSRKSFDALDVVVDHCVEYDEALANVRKFVASLNTDPEDIYDFQSAYAFFKNVVEPSWTIFSRDPETVYPFGEAENPLEHYNSILDLFHQLEVAHNIHQFPNARYFAQKITFLAFDEIRENTQLKYDHLFILDASLFSAYEFCSILAANTISLKSLTVAGNPLVSRTQSLLTILPFSGYLTAQRNIRQELAQFAPGTALESPLEIGNPGIKDACQFVTVNTSESPAGNGYQNIEEAEYCALLFIYMVILGYPESEIAILVAYPEQRVLVNEIITSKTAQLGVNASANILVATEHNGGKYKYLLVSLVKTTSTDIWTNPCVSMAAVQLATHGLYVFGLRKNYTKTIFSLLPAALLRLAATEKFENCTRKVSDTLTNCAVMKSVPQLEKLVCHLVSQQ
ncbi:hypothetical protein KL906_004623 [Ogataea polymorpha]|uniref:Uncharacterized protein n=1 Tax=Ogataea polymorpha TaxID=460523 RepID=A0A1B7SHC7_9ASCO|nr:uncharacterized protein OGAPODRAFT_76787 [Ogataea polymorpha]KAG7906170.1 hypothetical protein KL906_004623 [Ogataea polymorpha]KAG7930553.1 hypothetical protein KL934_004626 [Ogataea polymorpha]KAH3678733.1 hypothetical protein OGATHE_000283 [Ogataea polymorpha]OBA15904.1 hypothetical protein OGAPODRAFT_76787 [Ogataea polymorpha]